MKKELQKIVEHYFELYPDRTELYCTEDGNVFLQKSPAIDHALKTKQKWHAVANPAKVKEAPAETDKGQALKREAADGALGEDGKPGETPEEIAAEAAKAEEVGEADSAAEEVNETAESAEAEEEKPELKPEKAPAKPSSKTAKKK